MGTSRAKVIGVEFGRLTVRSYAGGGKWLCDCRCGTTVTAHLGDLRKSTKSCGCLRRDLAREKSAKLTKHGLSQTHEYDIWVAMWARCTNPNDAAYHNYGGRGIRVCHRWRKFENFIADIGFRPSAKHTLERKKNNGHYTPSNCVWETRTRQARNRRTNRLITFRGRTQCLSDWSDETGLHRQVIWDRLNTGWSVADALTSPAAKRTKQVKI